MSERQTSRGRKLSELAALAGLAQSLGGQGIQQAQLDSRDHNDRVNAALSLLGLQQQQQGQADQQAEVLRNHQELERLTGQGNTSRTNIDLLQAIQKNQMPGSAMSSEEEALIGQINPQLIPAYQQKHQQQADQERARVGPMVDALYKSGGSKLPQSLAAIEGTTSPNVWAGLPWQQLNDSLTPQAGAPSQHPIAEGFQQHGALGVGAHALAQTPDAIGNVASSAFRGVGHAMGGQDFDKKYQGVAGGLADLLQFLPQTNAYQPPVPSPNLKKKKALADQAQTQRLLNSQFAQQ